MDRGDLDDLAAFAVVARERSFTRAATELRLSTSALSYTIKKLEMRLGLRLLQRNSRSVSVTEAGEKLLQRLGPALAEIAGAIDDAGQQRDRVSGTVRVTATRHAFETVLRPHPPGVRREPSGSDRRGFGRVRVPRHRRGSVRRGNPSRRESREGHDRGCGRPRRSGWRSWPRRTTWPDTPPPRRRLN